MDGLKGDFTGFTFNGVHSSDLGITHVSEGDRYKDTLVPEIEDKTVEIPGLDGIYFYGSNFKSKNFSISIAFDGVTETQLRQMRTLFGYKHTGLLSFDEAPYKQYQVKVASAPEFEYICFDERKKVASTTPRDGVRVATREEVPYDTAEDPDNLYTNVGIDAIVDESVVSPIPQSTAIEVTREQVYPWEYVQDGQGNDVYERIYKGEGTIEFIAYYPFATQTHKFLDDFDQVNVNEWSAVSHLLQNKDTITGLDEIVGNQLIVYNAGDVPTGLMIWVPFGTGTESREEQREQSFTAEGQEDTYTFIIDDNPETITVFVDDIQLENGDYTYTAGNLSIGNTKLSEGQTVKVQYTVTETNEKKVTDWTNDLKLEYNDYELIISKDIQPQSKNDIGILINTVNDLVEGVRVVAVELDGNINYKTSGTVYNRYVRGHFFKIEPNNMGTYQVINVPSIPREPLNLYYRIINPTGNPQEQGWYEYNGSEYILTEDTEIDFTRNPVKTYYQSGDIRIFYNYLYF